MQECIESAIKNSCIWLCNKILSGVVITADFVSPIFLLICIGLYIAGSKKSKVYASGTVIIYTFIQIFRIFI